MDPIKYVVGVVREPVVRAPSGENAEWWKSRVVSAPNGESAGGESAVVRTPMVRCPVTMSNIDNGFWLGLEFNIRLLRAIFTPWF